MTCTEIRPLRDAQHEFRREYIRSAYEACGHNLSATARALGVDLSHLRRVVDIYQIPRPRKVCEG